MRGANGDMRVKIQSLNHRNAVMLPDAKWSRKLKTEAKIICGLLTPAQDNSSLGRAYSVVLPSTQLKWRATLQGW